MTDSNQFVLANHAKATNDLANVLSTKLQYLQELADAVAKQDDCAIYRLIDQNRYQSEILQNEVTDTDEPYKRLIADSYTQFSAYLSTNLIVFLRQRYPFFYFEETQTGQFRFYFGNWWGRRLFGTLDVLNVKFDFDEIEYQKLAQAFALEAQNKMINSDKIAQLSAKVDELQSLIDSQQQRDQQKDNLRHEIKRNSQEKALPWETGKLKEERQRLIAKLSELTELDEQAHDAHKKIRDYQEEILNLSKENTLLGYEKQSIVAKFGSFEGFEESNRILYRDYIAELIAKKGQVNVND
ncbi:exonuclease SbcC [Ligilactobacillus sp. Marseille-Q7487]|jgi:hypothetical protein|uniref:exonuclease SbcC n=1 Tax=Ligilactobacillus sp. Marseille-Q7487 TaxID=3022128 RepID=UPI0015B43921|nr:exonuclease SbcC [Ligilactobacillus sp. Marseille-Q7487]